MSVSTSVTHELAIPVTGDVVRTTAGLRLGHVTAVRPTEFQVALENKTRWISREAIFTAYNGEVTLLCEAAGLVAYTMLD